MKSESKKILSDNPLWQWMRGEFPFDRAKACNLCVTQHGALNGRCEIASHRPLQKAAKKLIKDWSGASPHTEEQAQGILRLRRKFYRLFQAAPREN